MSFFLHNHDINVVVVGFYGMKIEIQSVFIFTYMVCMPPTHFYIYFFPISECNNVRSEREENEEYFKARQMITLNVNDVIEIEWKINYIRQSTLFYFFHTRFKAFWKVFRIHRRCFT